MCRVGQNHICTVNIQYFCRDFVKHTVVYGVYIRFLPTLYMCANACGKACAELCAKRVHAKTCTPRLVPSVEVILN
jgi:hypothetical protein